MIFFAGGIWNVFACSSATKSLSNKLRLPSDLACLKSLEIVFHRVLTGDGDVSTGGEESLWNLENRRKRDVFVCGVTTSSATTKWMVPLDSTRQIGLGGISHKFSDCSNGLSKGGEVCLGGIF